MANIPARPPLWFWVVAVLSLLWSLVGCWGYLTQVSMDAADWAELPKAQADVWRATPDWVMGAYAVAVWSALGGSILLLLKRRQARLLYLLSLAAVVVQFGWALLVTPILRTVGPSAALLPLTIAAIGIYMLWFSGRAAGRGWLR